VSVDFCVALNVNFGKCSLNCGTTWAGISDKSITIVVLEATHSGVDKLEVIVSIVLQFNIQLPWLIE
jgi:hypothetical protein